MDGPLADCKRSFLDGFRTSRMGMTGPRQIFSRSTKLHQYGCFVNHFAGLAADNVHAKYTIRLRICENLHESVGGLINL